MGRHGYAITVAPRRMPSASCRVGTGTMMATRPLAQFYFPENKYRYPTDGRPARHSGCRLHSFRCEPIGAASAGAQGCRTTAEFDSWLPDRVTPRRCLARPARTADPGYKFTTTTKPTGSGAARPTTPDHGPQQ
jgi:hypothetical protein